LAEAATGTETATGAEAEVALEARTRRVLA
jgi:hypothetical protein